MYLKITDGFQMKMYTCSNFQQGFNNERDILIIDGGHEIVIPNPMTADSPDVEVFVLNDAGQTMDRIKYPNIKRANRTIESARKK